MRKVIMWDMVSVDGLFEAPGHDIGWFVFEDELADYIRETQLGADTLLFGRVTYEMMEAAWRLDTRTSTPPDWTEPFARTIHGMRKYVVSATLGHVEWNSELVRGDLGEAVRALKQRPGGPILTGGVQLPLALAELGLIDEYEFVMQPRIAGHGPTLLAGLSSYVELKLVDREELASGAVALRYQPRR